MKKIFKFGLFLGALAVVVCAADSFAATVKKQSALLAGTKVLAKVEAKGLYNEDCYNAYDGCMDKFCISDNENGGRCICSDESVKYESQLEDIRKILLEAEHVGTVKVGMVEAGANKDIIFGDGTRTYNEDGSVKSLEDKAKDVSTWKSIYDEEDEEDDEDWEDVDLSGKTGKALYTSAHELCEAQMPESCSKDMTLLTQMYARQIVSDCKGLANSIAQKKQEADATLAKANAAVRNALKKSLEESNEYDRGKCTIEFEKCVKGADVCGSDWSNCVFTVASENMQNNEAKSTAGTKVETINTYDITPSTMKILESKRYFCGKVLDKCVAVRDYIWDDFLRDAAPQIRLAELNIESKKRQSCLSDISNCIQKACKDDIAGKGTATMDACLARPDMARSFCKNEVDPCQRMEPQIWDYVVSKLAAMRVDACTAEVKDCFTSEDRCGKDFINCIGMDFDYIHDMCPIDKLVVCKQANPDFKMTDLDSMLMGLFLNIDNKALENCQNLAEQRMVELCGSATDCNTFTTDDYIGTGSLKSQKVGTVYRVTGMISFGSIKMGDAMGNVTDGKKVLAPGEIGIKDYLAELKAKNANTPGAEGIISSIEDELNNIAGTINRAISLLESDQQIQYCINGRDLSQINGKKSADNTTVARFPKLLNSYRVDIAMAALRKAQDNYNKKLNEAIAEATKESSTDIAQYMCQMIPSGGGAGLDDGIQTPLNAPYAISYDVGTGLDLKSLTSGGKDTSSFGQSVHTDESVHREGGFSTAAVTPLGGAGVGAKWNNSRNTKLDVGDSSQRSVTATFNRETRTCHICKTVSVENCADMKVSGRRIRKKDCNTSVNEECEDIQM